MGYSTPDPYYQPEKFGLTPLCEIDGNEPYQFHITIVWRHEDGTLYWAQDSGCSCPSPFEDFHSLEQLDKLPETWNSLEDVVANYYGYSAEDKSRFLNTVLAAMG